MASAIFSGYSNVIPPSPVGPGGIHGEFLKSALDGTQIQRVFNPAATNVCLPFVQPAKWEFDLDGAPFYVNSWELPKHCAPVKN